MAIIKSPNKQYTGVSASVFFVNGEGQTDDPKLIEWFTEKGYTVIDDSAEKEAKAEAERLAAEQNEKEEAERLAMEEKAAADQKVKDAEENNVDDNKDDKTTLSELTNDELKALLDEKGIEYKAKDNKDTLIELLSEE